MELRENAPRLGSRVGTPEGEGQVIGYNVPGDRLTVKIGSRRRQHEAHYGDTATE